MAKSMNLVLNVWRQAGPNQPGQFERYEAKDINDHMSFLEMLDVVNENLLAEGKEPIAFDHDCREGICGMCGVVINGREVGEIGLNAALAGAYGVPMIFVAGDRAAADEEGVKERQNQ